MKIITVCGSLKYQNEMMEITENREIEYAKSLGKEIIYYTDLIKEN